MIINIDGERPEHISPEDWKTIKRIVSDFRKCERNSQPDDRPDWQRRMLQTFGGDANA